MARMTERIILLEEKEKAEKKAKELRQARNKARALIHDAQLRYIKDKTRARSKKAAEAKGKSIVSILEEIANDFCDNYCKYPIQWDEEVEGYELCMSEICAECPINKLV